MNVRVNFLVVQEVFTAITIVDTPEDLVEAMEALGVEVDSR